MPIDDSDIAISVNFLKIMIVVLKVLEESMHDENTNFSRDENCKKEWNRITQNKKNLVSNKKCFDRFIVDPTQTRKKSVKLKLYWRYMKIDQQKLFKVKHKEKKEIWERGLSRENILKGKKWKQLRGTALLWPILLAKIGTISAHIQEGGRKKHYTSWITSVTSHKSKRDGSYYLQPSL